MIVRSQWPADGTPTARCSVCSEPVRFSHPPPVARPSSPRPRASRIGQSDPAGRSASAASRLYPTAGEEMPARSCRTSRPASRPSSSWSRGAPGCAPPRHWEADWHLFHRLTAAASRLLAYAPRLPLSALPHLAESSAASGSRPCRAAPGPAAAPAPSIGDDLRHPLRKDSPIAQDGRSTEAVADQADLLLADDVDQRREGRVCARQRVASPPCARAGCCRAPRRSTA
jgi:hypothetical protein